MVLNDRQKNLTVYKTLSAGLAKLGWEHMCKKCEQS